MKTLQIASTFLLVAACNGDANPPLETADAATEEADASSPDAPSEVAACSCVVGTQGGELTYIAIPSLDVEQDVAALSGLGQVTLRAFDSRVFAVSPAPENQIRVIDLATRELVTSWSTGLGTNPQDIAVVGDRAYVALADVGELQIWNVGDPATAELPVILSQFEGDGNPDATSVVVAGDTVFVSFAFLDAVGNPVARGAVFSMSLPDEQFDRLADLTVGTPQSLLVSVGDRAVASTAQFGAPEMGCGFDVVEAGEFTSSCEVTNAELGGVVIASAAAADGGFVVVRAADDSTSLKRISNGTVESVSIPASRAPTAVALCESTNQLIYADDEGSGIRVLDLATGTEVTSSALDIGGAPIGPGALVCTEN